MAVSEAVAVDEILARVGRLAHRALPLYGLSPRATATLINHSENFTYRVDDPAQGKTFALRVHRIGYHSRQAIESELQWMIALRRDAGVETPEPIAGTNGNLIQTVGNADPPEERFCVMFKFMAGREPAEDELLGPFERLGEVSGRIHLHSRSWRRPAGFTRHTWDYETSLGSRPIWGRWQDGMGLTPDRLKLLTGLADRLEARLGRFGKPPGRFGLVHADLRLANLLIEGERTKAIDFDDCGFSWYLYDLGTALSFIEHRPDVPALVDSWVTGYRRVVDLAAEDEAEIPTFILLRRLLLVAWIGSHSETQLAQEQGVPFTEGACDLAESYLARFG